MLHSTAMRLLRFRKSCQPPTRHILASVAYLYSQQISEELHRKLTEADPRLVDAIEKLAASRALGRPLPGHEPPR